MNTVKRWLAGFLSFAMIFTSAAFSNVTVFAATGNNAANGNGNPVAESDVVAEITNNEGLSTQKVLQYKSLQEAFNDAEDGDTIVLKKDDKSSQTVDAYKAGTPDEPAIERNITLDLNGNAIGDLNVTGNADYGVTVIGSGKITGALSGCIYLDGFYKNCPTVTSKGSISGLTSTNPVKWGIFYSDPSDKVANGQAILHTTDANEMPIWKVGNLEEKWTWASDTDVTLDFLIEGSKESLLVAPYKATANDTPSIQDETCLDYKYTFIGAEAKVSTATLAGGKSIWFNSNSTIKGLETTERTFTTDTRGKRRVKDDKLADPTGHDYVAKSGYSWVIEDADVAEDADGHPVYETALECQNHGCAAVNVDNKLEDVRGAVSTTVGETISFTYKGVTYKTVTTEAKKMVDADKDGKAADTDKETDCSNIGDYWALKFNIVNAADKTIFEGAKLNYFIPIPKGTHDTNYPNTNIKGFWVYEKNGVEVEIAADDVQTNAIAKSELLSYAADHEDQLVYRLYGICPVCGAKTLLNKDAEPVKADIKQHGAALGTAAKGTADTWMVTDGSYVLEAEDYVGSYVNPTNKRKSEYTISAKIEKEITATSNPSTADSGKLYNDNPDAPEIASSGKKTLFNANTFPTSVGTVSTILEPTAHADGIQAIRIKSGQSVWYDVNGDGAAVSTSDKKEKYYGTTNGTVYQILPATEEHNWKKIEANSGNSLSFKNGASAGNDGLADDDKAMIGDIASKWRSNYFDGINATASTDGFDGFDVWYCKTGSGTKADPYQYHYALTYKNEAPSGDPDIELSSFLSGTFYENKNDSHTIGDTDTVANGTLVNDATSKLCVYGKNGDADNAHKAKHWTYTVMTTNNIDQAGYKTVGSANPTSGILESGYLAVNYRPQYENNGQMVNADAGTELTVYYATGGNRVDPATYPTGVTQQSNVAIAPYSLKLTNPEDVPCDEYVTYAASNATLFKVNAGTTPAVTPASYNFAEGLETYTFVTSTKGTQHTTITGNVTWKGATPTVALICDRCAKDLTSEDARNNLKVTHTDVKAKCLEDGYKEYKATYRGVLDGVTLKNDTNKVVDVEDKAPGHAVSPTSKLLLTKDGDEYKAKVYCSVCEDYVDVVDSIEGPKTENDKTRTIKINYTNGLPASVEGKIVANYRNWESNDTDKLVSKGWGLTQTRTLIDEGALYLNTGDQAGNGTDAYRGRWTDFNAKALVNYVQIENEDKLAGYELPYSSKDDIHNSEGIDDALDIKVFDAEGNEIVAPMYNKDAKVLPVGKYKVVVNGIGDYAGTIEEEVNIIENASIDSSIVLTRDGDDFAHRDYYSDEGFAEDDFKSTYTCTYDARAHVIAAAAYTNSSYKTVDKDVSFSYKLDGKEVTADDLKFENAGTYDLEITASKANYQPTVIKFKYVVNQAPVTVAIDNSSMVEGNEPEIRRSLTCDDVKDVTEEILGLTITTTGKDKLTSLRPGTYTLTATITNDNYRVNVTGGTYTSGSPTLTVYAADASTAQEQALAAAAEKKINDLTADSTEAEVAAARKSYDALSANAKNRISAATLKKLTDAEDAVAANKVIAAINNAKTDAEKAAAYDAYNKLSAGAKAKVDANAAAKAKLAEAKTAADKTAANNVVGQLNKVTASMSQADAKKVVAAYNALTADQKKLVDANSAAAAKLATAKQIANRKNATYKVSKKTYKIKRGKTAKIKVSGKGGKKTFKKTSGKKFITVTKAGKIKVKKSAKKGKTYKIKVKVTAPQTTSYNKFNKTYSIKIKVK